MSQTDKLVTRVPALSEIVRIAEAAGVRILEVYNGADFEVERKADDSPLTLADRRAHELIEQELIALAPDIQVLSEESTALPFAQRREWPRYWLVAPLDGTTEFISRNGEFTVNIALLEDGRATLGVVPVPVPVVTYFGSLGSADGRDYSRSWPSAGGELTPIAD